MKKMLLLIPVVVMFIACNNASGGWSASEKNKAVAGCREGMPEDLGDKAMRDNICDCAIEKLSKKYPSFEEFENKSTEAEGQQVGAACAKEYLGNSLREDVRNSGENNDD